MSPICTTQVQRHSNNKTERISHFAKRHFTMKITGTPQSSSFNISKQPITF